MSKLKGSVAFIKMKYLLFVFATVLFVSLPTRVYQLLAIVDTENGFYKSSDVTITLLYIVAFLFVLLIMGMSFLSKEVPSPKLPTGKNPLLGITSAVMVVGLFWDVFAIEKTVVRAVGDEFILSNFLETLKLDIADNGGMLLVLRVIFAILAIFYFLVFSISHLTGKGSYKEFKLLALAPLCWSMVSLIDRLMSAISFISVSELLFEIFMLVFAMLFFLTFARISSGIFTVDSMWGIYGYGLSACVFAGLVTIPRIAVVIAGKDLVPGYEFSFAHLSLLVFIFSYIIASLGVGFKDGIATRKTITEVQLPDDDMVVIKKDVSDVDAVDMWDDNEIPDLDLDVEPQAEYELVDETVSVEPELEMEFSEEFIEAEPEVEIEAEPVAEVEVEPEFIDEAFYLEPEVEEEVAEENIEAVPEVEIEAEPEVETEADYEEEIASEPQYEIIAEAPVAERKPVKDSISASDKLKKVFSFGKKDEVQPEVIKPVSLADLRKNKD